ncbi:NUDIX hydrolase [Desulfuromonas sp. TF]|uniref:NUDIX hydrolase n=1 Tax=Desulfuromonas sp. TF TaxID=1232410 RepID=UPI0003FD257F|nr:NUDIX hydrolase [Desulfuromonas sp. TF]
METRPSWFYRQSGVIPFRQFDGRLEVLLVTNRRRRRWIIPKGIIEPGLSATESAAREAWEEAGVLGAIRSFPVGEYRYAKWGGICTVQVFLLRVDEVLGSWPEGTIRGRVWLSPREAADRVREEELRPMLLRLPDLLIHSGVEQDWTLFNVLKEAPE